MRRLVFFLITVAFAAVGCDDGGISKKEMDSIKDSPAMTDADRLKVANGMREGAERARAQEREWLKSKTPEEIAEINADRAKMGRPPLGGG